MRLRRLHLMAFGPFTDRHLDFGDGAPDFHLVYGPNEAGKSSALRALTALLYGIPGQTRDHFRHEYKDLRLGGTLERRDGAALQFIRRKGQKDTLLSADADQRPIGENALDPFLRGTDQHLFTTVFGIDHAALVAGAQMILNEGGAVGESLFAAGLGGLNLAQVMADLENETKALFALRGKDQTVNRALSDFAAAKRAVAETSLAAGDWEAHEQALASARSEAEQVASEVQNLKRQEARLERQRRVLPIVARRAEGLKRLAAMGEVVVLSADFAERRQDAERRLEAARETLESAAADIERLAADGSALIVPQALLVEEAAVTRLHERLDSHRKAAHDLPTLRAEEQHLRAAAEDLLRDLGPDLPLERLETWRLTAAERTRIRTLGQEYQRLVERAEQAAAAVGCAERRAAETRRKLEIELARLGLWTGALDEIERLPVPALESIDVFEKRVEGQEKTRTRLAERIAQAEEAQRDLTRRIEEPRLAGAVLTETDLAAARQRRDTLWQHIRENEARVSRSQAVEFEHAIAAADELADRLRREADRVARHAEFLTQRQARTEELERLRCETAENARQAAEAQAAWIAAWQPAGIAPRTPREMRDWFGRYQVLLTGLAALRTAERETQDAADDRDRAQECLRRWREQWAEAVRCLELAGDALPEEADEVLDRFDQLVAAWKDRKALAERIEGIERDVAEFGEAVAALVGRLTPDLAGLPAEEAADRLFTRLVQAQKDQATKAGLERQMADRQTAVTEAERTIRAIEQRLADLCREARCDTPDDLPERERQSNEHRSLREQVSTAENEMLAAGGGAPLADLLAEAAEANPDELPQHLDDVRRRLAEREARKSELDRTIGREEEALRGMAGRAAAADAAEEAQQALARARAGIERYLCLRLALRVLRRAVERYRSANQAPLLRRASDHFAALTRGAFTGLRADYGEDDRPVLVGVRDSGEHLGVEAMSDGTRDQLYLSLRLATLERLIESNEPMPFVVDDILIRFDDERAAATLGVLADLSRRTQILLFTHHARLVDLAQALGEERARIHRL